MALKPSLFQSCFENWISRLASDKSEAAIDLVAIDLVAIDLVAIDGKALRRSHNRSASLGPSFLVSAWAVQRGISLGQLAIEEKSNEITAIPDLIDQIDIGNSIVTKDAAVCQTKIAAKIIAGKGNYVLALKGNQGTLYKAASDYIALHMENGFTDIAARKHVEVLKGHARTDEITYYQMAVPKDLVGSKKWKGLKTIGVAIRQSESGEKWSSEVRYSISSLPLSVKRFAASVRGHWGIENTLHWCLDVTFREDENRVRNRTLADNIAWLKRVAISMLKQVDDKESVAMRRRMVGWNPDYLAKALGIPA
jgi:predicted transposase YbfD/YdcC